MATARSFLLCAIILVLPTYAARANSPAEETASKARLILRKHCGECHGTVNPRAGLSALDRASLVERRRVVVLGKPEESELLQLVEAGTMPPGTRPKISDADRDILGRWIRDGAPEFPLEYGEPFVLTAILKDVRALKKDPETLAATRYFSLNHYLADAEADLASTRKAFGKALDHLSLKQVPVRADPIDANQTIFRVDIRQLGWDEKPYEKSTLNLYDLILLEYPYAALPDASETSAAISNEYFAAANLNLVRPIPFVHADWLVLASSRPPLDMDLQLGRVKTPLSDLQKFKERKPESINDSRRIFPLDGLSFLQHNPKHPSMDVALEAVNWTDKDVATVFHNGDKIFFRVTNRGKQSIFFQLIFWVENEKTHINEAVLVQENRLGEGKSYVFPPSDGKPPWLQVQDQKEKSLVVLFASEEQIAEADCTIIHDRVSGRCLHDFYLLRKAGKPFDASGLVKKSIEIGTQETKK